MDRENAQAHLDGIMVFLVERRKELGWTQTDVADVIGTSQRRVSYIENGASATALDLIRYADAMGLKIALKEKS